MANISKRLSDLESLANDQEKPVGVRWPENPDQVKLQGSGETMPLADFRARYPAGTVITVNYGSEPI